MTSTDLLNADALLAQAEAETGFNDYGDPTLRDRFRLVVDYLRNGNMDEAGQRAGAECCLWLLTTRLQFFEDRKRYPLAEEKIEQPLFALGEARSGTTFLQALLAADPNNRSLRFWENMYPSPPPGLAGPDDPRRARADAFWAACIKKIPAWLVSHPYNDMLGNGFPECERTWNFDFRVMTATAWWNVPVPMNTAGLPQDPAQQYRLHRMMLQNCQYGRPKKRWVLKGFHQTRLKVLLEAYPDARLIWVHRDPIQVMASRVVFMSELEEGITGQADLRDYVRKIMNPLTKAGYAATLNDPMIDDPRIHHVRYRDFVTDPVGTIRGFYEKFDVPFEPATEAAMREYLKNNKADRYGKFRYSTDVIGEDIDDLNREFAPYRERFGLEIEQRK